MPLLPGDHPEQELKYAQINENLLIDATQITANSFKVIAAKFAEIDERLNKLEHDNEAIHQIEEVLHNLQAGG
jgi:hypothetical protein